ncbi:unnamed protein product, partial [Ectocarpus sp. 12 AP-2014]
GRVTRVCCSYAYHLCYLVLGRRFDWCPRMGMGLCGGIMCCPFSPTVDVSIRHRIGCVANRFPRQRRAVCRSAWRRVVWIHVLHSISSCSQIFSIIFNFAVLSRALAEGDRGGRVACCS